MKIERWHALVLTGLIAACGGVDGESDDSNGDDGSAGGSAPSSGGSSSGGSSSGGASGGSGGRPGGGSGGGELGGAGGADAAGGTGGDVGGGGAGSENFCDEVGSELPWNDYVSNTGERHWLRRTVTTSSYTRVPSGAASSTVPPKMARIARICADSKGFVFRTLDGKFGRVDLALEATTLHACAVAEDLATENEAAAVPAADATNWITGCNGGAWIALDAEGA